jgi:hypothetical protein
MPNAKCEGQFCKYAKPHVRHSSSCCRSFLSSPVNLPPTSISNKKNTTRWGFTRLGGAIRSGARDGRGGGRASSLQARGSRHTGGYLLPASALSISLS